jgi:hypothetical protein
MSVSEDKDLLQGTWWFPLRRRLPGWGLPVRWQGWLVFAAYFALLLGPAPILHGHLSGYFMTYALVLTVILGLVIVLKGEKPR